VFVGRAASDIQHLLAELLDNATNFSAADTTVVMSCSRARDDSILVEIFDHGIGLSPGELVTLNERLRNPAEATATVAASRRMGLFVVGRLAARHGIWVGLFTDSMGSVSGPGGPRKHGVTARVTIPAELVAEREDTPDQVLWSRFDAAPPLPDRIGVPPGRPGSGSGTDGGRHDQSPERAPALATTPAPPAPSPSPHRELSGADTMRLPVVPAQPAPVQPAPRPAPHAPPPIEPVPSEPLRAELLPVETLPVEPEYSLFEPLVAPSALPGPDAPRPPDPLAAPDPDATPIFAEVTSGWFHSPEPTPRSDGSGAESFAPGVTPVTADPATFVTAADSGWQAAHAAAAARVEGGLTRAGLPKRVPRNRLLPGNAGPGTPVGESSRNADAVRGRLATFQRGIRDGRQNRPRTGRDKP
jgi:hypothetical protein